MSAKRLKLRFSTEVREDLRAITRYTIYKFGERQAVVYGKSLAEIIEKLRENSSLGILRPELGEGLRSIVHNSHLVFFLADSEFLSVIRILHQSRDVPKLF